MTDTTTGTTTTGTTTGEVATFPKWRRRTAGFLIVLSCVLVPVSVLAVWVRNQLLNTDRYVENVKPLASNPVIIDTTATNLTNLLFDNVDVQQIAEDSLPARAKFLAGPLAAGVRDAVDRAAVGVLSSDQFQTVWIEANRVAHEQVRKALTNEGKVVSTANGKIELDLSAVIDQVRLRLDQRGLTIFDRIPIKTIALKFELLDSDSLEQAQQGTKLLNKLAWVLPVLAVLALAGGLALSPNRRRSLLRWGIGVAVASGVVGASVTVGRSFYLDAVTSETLSRATAAAVFDTLVRFLRQGVRVMIALGLVVALGAWLSGPSGAATRLRATSRSVLGNAGDAASSRGWNFGGFGDWVGAHRGPVRVASVLVTLLILVAWEHPRALTVVGLGLVLLVLLGMIEFVARAAADPDAESGEPAIHPESPRVG
jgi:hypothetical protein